MDKFLRIHPVPLKQLDRIESDLRGRGIELLWVSESLGALELGIASTDEAKNLLKELSLSFEEFADRGIDWDQQWAAFAKGDAVDGVYEIALNTLGLENAGSISLKAGPGFGDLSHPTTQLMLKMMESCCFGRHCLDIGSGSGILTVAALKLGASFVHACDIDAGAVLHTKGNIALNHLEGRALVETPDRMWEKIERKPPDNPLILINMIESEQRQALAWQVIKRLMSYTLLASGLIKGDERGYIDWVQSFGPKIQYSVIDGEWTGLAFQFDAG